MRPYCSGVDSIGGFSPSRARTTDHVVLKAWRSRNSRAYCPKIGLNRDGVWIRSSRKHPRAASVHASKPSTTIKLRGRTASSLKITHCQ